MNGLGESLTARDSHGVSKDRLEPHVIPHVITQHSDAPVVERVALARQRRTIASTLSIPVLRMLCQALTHYRGVEFQLRTKRPSSSRDYPLTFDQRVQEGDRFRLSEAKLTNTLKAIEQNFASEKSGPPHTGKPDCQRCGEKKRQIWQAYFEYYLGNEVGRWDSGLSSYREEMQIMMNSIPDRCTLGDVHARFEHELREHLKKDLSTPDQNLDTVDLAELKRLTMEQFDRGTPTQEILEGRLNAELKSPALHSSDAIAFMTALQRSKTSHDRIQIYIKYYCTPLWNDTPQQKSIKSRFARHFESGMSHDAVLGMWKKEALESQNVEIGKLKKEMGDLQMAQSAHLREKLKKAEKDQKMEDVAADYVHVQKQTAKCLLERCERDINLTEGEVLECALCDWLASKDRSERRNHAYYCCEQHVEEDFVIFQVSTYAG
jgi:hypothetical protein